jgi:hypothetical protein
MRPSGMRERLDTWWEAMAAKNHATYDKAFMFVDAISFRI